MNFELPPQRYYAIVRRQREPQSARTVRGADSGCAARAADPAGKSRRGVYGRCDFAELAGAARRHRDDVHGATGCNPGALVPCTVHSRGAAPARTGAHRIAPVAPVRHRSGRSGDRGHRRVLRGYRNRRYTGCARGGDPREANRRQAEAHAAAARAAASNAKFGYNVYEAGATGATACNAACAPAHPLHPAHLTHPTHPSHLPHPSHPLHP